MSWEIVSTADESSFLDDQVAEILSSENVTLPPFDQSISHVDVHWTDVGDRRAFIQSRGGTADDQVIARQVVAAQLASCGFREATRDWGMEKTADWNEIMQHAKMLMQDGSVQILRNGYNNIVAQVRSQSDPSKTYQSEIFRQDPTSRAISGSDCECVLPGGRVILADGSSLPVEECVPGTRVLMASGYAGTVKRLIANEYDGEAISLQPSGSTEKVWVTANHPIFDRVDNIVEADQLGVGDVVYYPQAQESAEFVIRPMEFLDPDRFVEADGRVWVKNLLWDSPYASRRAKVSGPYKRSAYSLPAEIEFSESFARLVGLYLAEGSLVSTHTHEIRWHFDYEGREDNLVRDVQEALTNLGLNSWVEHKEHGTVVCCGSYQLVQIFAALFGTGARSKRIDQRVMQLPDHVLRPLMEAWIDGDGNRENMGCRDSIATASLTLACQLRYLLARICRESTIRRTDDNSSKLVPGGKDLYTVTWRTRGGRGQSRHWFEDDVVCQVLQDPERKRYSGVVYNLEVEDEHTYVMYPGIACHNCGWGEFQNQPRTRQWKKFQDRPCKHILAAFWQAQSMPLDEDANPQSPQGGPQQPGGFGQGSGFGAPADQGFDPAQRSFDPSGAMGQTAGPGGPAPQGAGEAPPGPSPADVLPQYPMAQMPQPQPQNLVSIPGGSPPTPTNPVQYPAGPGGTFSSVRSPGIWDNPWQGWEFTSTAGDGTDVTPSGEYDPEPTQAAPTLQNGDMVQLRYPDTGTLVGRSEEHGAGQDFDLNPGMVGEVLGTHPTTGMHNVLWMGKPFDQNGRMEPFGAVGWHFPSYLLPRRDIKKPGPAIRRRR